MLLENDAAGLGVPTGVCRGADHGQPSMLAPPLVGFAHSIDDVESPLTYHILDMEMVLSGDGIVLYERVGGDEREG